MCGGERGQRRDPLSPRSRHLSSHLLAAPSWPDCRRQRTRIMQPPPLHPLATLPRSP